MTLRQAIIEWILSKKSCEHDWEQLEAKRIGNKINPDYKWNEYLYRCKKCCEARKITGE